MTYHKSFTILFIISSLIFSCSEDKVINPVNKIENIIKLEKFAEFQGDSYSINQVKFSAIGNEIIVAGNSPEYPLKMFDSNGNFIHNFIGHSKPVLSIDISQSGILASASEDGTTKLWDIYETSYLFSEKSNYNNVAKSVSFSSSGNFVALGYASEGIKVYNIQTPESPQYVQYFSAYHPYEGSNFLYTPITTNLFLTLDEKYVVSMSDKIQFWQISNDYLENEFDIHDSKISGYFFNKESGQLITICPYEEIKIWDTYVRRLDYSLSNNNYLNAITLSYNDTTITVAYNDFLEIMSIRSGKILATFQTNNSRITSVDYNRNNSLLATGHINGKVSLWIKK